MSRTRQPRADQTQFLEVLDRDEAQRRFHAAVRLEPLGEQPVDLGDALGRVLARDVVAGVDVPSFDRSDFDGYAARAADTYGAAEERPCRLALTPEVVASAVVPRTVVEPGTAVAIATGGMLPRGADAVVMVEHADIDQDELVVRHPVAPGFGVTFTGTDIAAGETVLRRGDRLTSRETGVLAAIGVREVWVRRRPRVAVLSTGDEILEPGAPMRPGLVYDSNARIIADAVRELGAEPVELGIVRDDLDQLRDRVHGALASCDLVLLSGGTSKGAGDLCCQVVGEFGDPGIVAHGVALKPGKPICLAATGGKALVVLPGFPTSAVFTFHEFVAPVLARLGGRPLERGRTVRARLAMPVNSEIGRTEYLLVGLVDGPEADPTPAPGRAPAQPPRGGPAEHTSLVAYPMGKGSGSVTAFSRADGFITIGRHQELVESGTELDVRLLGRDLAVADLVVVGSHCVGLDYLLGRLQEQGLTAKFLAVGSVLGLEAARRGECDLAGIHLLDPLSGQYNRPFLTPDLVLLEGYGRMQGVLFRPGDVRFRGRDGAEAVRAVKADAATVMVNRNRGSGTRILLDQLLDGAQPPGYAVQPRNHNAVAAAVAQGRADWGVAIRSVADAAKLAFLPLVEERFDFVVPVSRQGRPALGAFRALLADATVRDHLESVGLRPSGRGPGATPDATPDAAAPAADSRTGPPRA